MSKVRVDIDEKTFISEIVLDNPPVNALNSEMVIELVDAAGQIESQIEKRKVRVVILRSEGKHFCAGADLKERLSVAESEVADKVKSIRKAVESIWALKVPVIAAINGSALGGGLELALAADIRIASLDSRMGLKEVLLAIMPGAGGTQRLSRIVGIGIALDWISTGRDISTEEALRAGLISDAVPEEQLLDKAKEIAHKIAKNGPVGVQAAKKAIREGFDLPFEESLEIEWAEYLKTISTKDRLEGLQAFSEKRKPVYKGY
ncbi:MAG: enoyl-CoA hydratase/isomerase family protein [Candidatus Marinimicrobia bacterium]|nr:enoyl-CoA hydratase/isomerase family protein [Candidatus Neomarinimicrobiota bacterium]